MGHILSQEMVNLLITGKAVSNTFDNVMEVDTGGAEKVKSLRHTNNGNSLYIVYRYFIMFYKILII